MPGAGARHGIGSCTMDQRLAGQIGNQCAAFPRIFSCFFSIPCLATYLAACRYLAIYLTLDSDMSAT